MITSGHLQPSGVDYHGEFGRPPLGKITKTSSIANFFRIAFRFLDPRTHLSGMLGINFFQMELVAQARFDLFSQIFGAKSGLESRQTLDSDWLS